MPLGLQAVDSFKTVPQIQIAATSGKKAVIGYCIMLWTAEQWKFLLW